MTQFSEQSHEALVGRKQIGKAFANFLALFDVVYHINGQQTVTITSDKASGISYCEVTLIGDQNGQKMKTKMGVHYKDDYVKRNGKWLIVNRQSTFA
ncbi:nuclear transport factor 2 family protein [Spirosoma endophyticum]|uniref:SnoaL-like domain-containing protein n=1 Tax=Spirosoma endophyticum TaxID=662367 RepID=A0A1I2G844_9BACT|nr:nuclear transport factor 2 family protein [Spirosoma endophyticum]SFF13339.1 SnoaL-like domain-containing protein [Spirosoma endophyticum]